MSASEKLKALNDLTTYPTGVIARSDAVHIRGRTLLDALPQIVAVVEAAEEWKESEEGFLDGTHDAPQAIEQALGRLRTALSALDQALS